MLSLGTWSSTAGADNAPRGSWAIGIVPWTVSRPSPASWGFGPWFPATRVARDAAPIRQTRDYLDWLEGAMRTAAANGMDMNEVLVQPYPREFAGTRRRFERVPAFSYTSSGSPEQRV